MKIRVEGFGSWRKWSPGATFPLPDMKPGTLVMVRYRDGSEHLARFEYDLAEQSQWIWSKENRTADIVAYSLPQLVIFDEAAACQSGGAL